MDDELVLRPCSPNQYEYTTDDMENSLFASGADNRLRELEASSFGASQPLSHAIGKGKQPVKRQAPGGESDASNDLEVVKRDEFGYTAKRRKLDNHAADTADELERSLIGEQHHSSPGKPSPFTAAKGKAKQNPMRDGTPDSISMTLKAPRKKPGPRKKLDNLPPETLELLGLGSGPPSVYGDITPSVSRPASPALTATSNVVYELDEAIPPLRRAKKVDEAAMLKRVKALEEAQRKVWTNIARRDVAKVPIIVLVYISI